MRLYDIGVEIFFVLLRDNNEVIHEIITLLKMMKYLIYLLLPLVFISCEREAEVEYTILNKTSKHIKIVGFQRSIEIAPPPRAEVIDIAPNSKFTIMKLNNTDKITAYYSLNEVDSVRVIFDDTKVLTYVCDNLINGNCNSIFGTKGNFEHIITEQDYQNAQDCNGDCD